MKQFDGSNYFQCFPQNIPPDIINQFVNVSGTNSNDVFNYLGKYCQYWWRKYFEGQVTEYSEIKTDITKTVEIYSEYRYRYNYEETPPAPFSFQFSRLIAIDSERIKLKEAKNYTITFITYDYLIEWEEDCITKINLFLKENTPCYCKFSDVIYYLPQGTTVKKYNETATIRIQDYTDDNDNDHHIIKLSYVSSTRPTIKAQTITANSKTYTKTETQYVNSTNQSAYPDGEKVDNWLYTYLGVPFENTIEKTQFACGTYIGTGASGSNSPNGLQFNFTPKIIFIIGDNKNAGFGIYDESIYSLYDTSGLSDTVWGNKNISWFAKDSYSNSVRPIIQFNDSGRKYCYLALG